MWAGLAVIGSVALLWWGVTGMVTATASGVGVLEEAGDQGMRAVLLVPRSVVPGQRLTLYPRGVRSAGVLAEVRMVSAAIPDTLPMRAALIDDARARGQFFLGIASLLRDPAGGAGAYLSSTGTGGPRDLVIAGMEVEAAIDTAAGSPLSLLLRALWARAPR
jgi:hypothetical protein